MNSIKISGEILKITNELKNNNKGCHLCLKNDIKYILFADIDKVTTIEEVKRILSTNAINFYQIFSILVFQVFLKQNNF